MSYRYIGNNPNWLQSGGVWVEPRSDGAFFLELKPRATGCKYEVKLYKTKAIENDVIQNWRNYLSTGGLVWRDFGNNAHKLLNKAKLHDKPGVS